MFLCMPLGSISNRPFSDSDSFYNSIPHSLLKVQASYRINNLLLWDIKQLNKIRKLYYFHTLKALWNGQDKINMYYGMPRVKKQLSGKRSILPHCFVRTICSTLISFSNVSAFNGCPGIHKRIYSIN